MSTSSALLATARAGDEAAYRRLVEPHRPELHAHCYERLRELVERDMDAMQRGDVEAVVAMLAEDGAWSMPPRASWYRGHDALRVFLAHGPLTGEWCWRHLAAQANGQPAVGAYTWQPEERSYRPFALDVLTLRGTRIQEITSFITRSPEGLDRDDLARFPAHPVDPSTVGAMFERVGLPGRLD